MIARLIVRRVATLADIQSVYSLADLLNMNEAIDWHDALEASANESHGG